MSGAHKSIHKQAHRIIKKSFPLLVVWCFFMHSKAQEMRASSQNLLPLLKVALFNDSMKKQFVPADKVFDFLQIVLAYYKQTAIASSEYCFYYTCPTQLSHGWQAPRRKWYIRCFKWDTKALLQSTTEQLWKLKSTWKPAPSNGIQVIKKLHFSLLYATRIETDHLNHVWAGKQSLPLNMKV